MSIARIVLLCRTCCRYCQTFFFHLYHPPYSFSVQTPLPNSHLTWVLNGCVGGKLRFFFDESRPLAGKTVWDRPVVTVNHWREVIGIPGDTCRFRWPWVNRAGRERSFCRRISTLMLIAIDHKNHIRHANLRCVLLGVSHALSQGSEDPALTIPFDPERPNSAG